MEEAPELSSDSDAVEHIYRQSLVDLAALRFYSILFPGESLPAAGLPWFMNSSGGGGIRTLDGPMRPVTVSEISAMV